MVLFCIWLDSVLFCRLPPTAAGLCVTGMEEDRYHAPFPASDARTYPNRCRHTGYRERHRDEPVPVQEKEGLPPGPHEKGGRQDGTSHYG